VCAPQDNFWHIFDSSRPTVFCDIAGNSAPARRMAAGVYGRHQKYGTRPVYAARVRAGGTEGLDRSTTDTAGSNVASDSCNCIVCWSLWM